MKIKHYDEHQMVLDRDKVRLLGTEEQELQGRRLARPDHVQDKNGGERSHLVQKLTMAKP